MHPATAAAAAKSATRDSRVWTIGHSTRPIGEFLDLLTEFAIEAIADVRRFPGSRRQPQFAQDALRHSLEDSGRAYRWLPKLGGRRTPAADSPNTVWRNAAFRGYADHLASEEFAEGLTDLTMIAGGVRTAIMCAEAVWWRCHRSMIADVLKSVGFDVIHILGPGSAKEHPYTPPARIVNGVLTYPAVVPSA